MRCRASTVFLCAALLHGMPSLAGAQEPGAEAAKPDAPPANAAPVIASRLVGPIKLDGSLDDAGWSTAGRIDTFYETVFGDNRAPCEDGGSSGL